MNGIIEIQANVTPDEVALIRREFATITALLNVAISARQLLRAKPGGDRRAARKYLARCVRELDEAAE
jgi:hypothetical protein